MLTLASGGLLMVLALGGGDSGPIRLPPCPQTPNCVSTQATGSQGIEPFRYTGAAGDAMRRLLSVLDAMPRTAIVARSSNSVTVEFRTAIFRFVDDATFIVDDRTKTIQFRSASRVGRSDLGVNRRRMETIRSSFAAP